MKIHNMLRDDNINNQVNTAILFGLWRGDFTRLSDNQEVLLLDRKWGFKMNFEELDIGDIFMRIYEDNLIYMKIPTCEREDKIFNAVVI